MKRPTLAVVVETSERCIVAAEGWYQEIALLHLISATVIENALYSNEPLGEMPDYLRHTPKKDGVYLLIDGKWVLE